MIAHYFAGANCFCSSGARSASLGALAALQGAHIGDDRPAVIDGDVRPVSSHGVLAIRDRIKDLAVRHDADAIVLEVRHGRPAANGLNDPVADARCVRDIRRSEC